MDPESRKKVLDPESHKQVLDPESHTQVLDPESHKQVLDPESHKQVLDPESHKQVLGPESKFHSEATNLSRIVACDFPLQSPSQSSFPEVRCGEGNRTALGGLADQGRFKLLAEESDCWKISW